MRHLSIEGIHDVNWKAFTDEPFDPRPVDKPLTVASSDAGGYLTAYVDPVAVGDVMPAAQQFLAQGRYVELPLEKTYLAAWAEAPPPIRELVEKA